MGKECLGRRDLGGEVSQMQMPPCLLSSSLPPPPSFLLQKGGRVGVVGREGGETREEGRHRGRETGRRQLGAGACVWKVAEGRRERQGIGESRHGRGRREGWKVCAGEVCGMREIGKAVCLWGQWWGVSSQEVLPGGSPSHQPS